MSGDARDIIMGTIGLQVGNDSSSRSPMRNPEWDCLCFQERGFVLFIDFGKIIIIIIIMSLLFILILILRCHVKGIWMRGPQDLRILEEEAQFSFGSGSDVSRY